MTYDLRELAIKTSKKDRDLTPVTSLDDPFWAIWRNLRPLVQKALETADEYSIGDVLHFAYTGQWQVWHTDKSVAFTRIARYPEHTTCVLVLAAGDLEDIAEYEPRICAWAKKQDCKYMEIFGRRGWQKALDGYSEQYAVLRKGLL